MDQGFSSNHSATKYSVRFQGKSRKIDIFESESRGKLVVNVAFSEVV